MEVFRGWVLYSGRIRHLTVSGFSESEGHTISLLLTALAVPSTDRLLLKPLFQKLGTLVINSAERFAPMIEKFVFYFRPELIAPVIEQISLVGDWQDRVDLDVAAGQPVAVSFKAPMCWYATDMNAANAVVSRLIRGLQTIGQLAELQLGESPHCLNRPAFEEILLLPLVRLEISCAMEEGSIDDAMCACMGRAWPGLQILHLPMVVHQPVTIRGLLYLASCGSLRSLRVRVDSKWHCPLDHMTSPNRALKRLEVYGNEIGPEPVELAAKWLALHFVELRSVVVTGGWSPSSWEKISALL